MLLFFLKLSLTENQAVHIFGFLAYILNSKLVVKFVGFGAIFYIQHFTIGKYKAEWNYLGPNPL